MPRGRMKSGKIPGHLLIKLLNYIPSDCDRDTWWKVGAALKAELGEKQDSRLGTIGAGRLRKL